MILRKCGFCKKDTGIYLREHKLGICPSCYPGWFEKQVAETIRKFKMFRPEDKILVAVSGGKDSLTLWQVLSRLGYEADGFYVSLGISKHDYSQVSKQKCLDFAAKLGRKLHVIDLESEVGMGMDGIRKYYRKVCSACGTIKRYFMNRVTLEHGYSVIATGHNLDDEVTTLFSNLIQWQEGYLKRQYPVIPERNGLARKVKPLVRHSERHAAIYALTAGIDYIRDECPYSFSATSISYKENLNRLEEDHPGILRFFLTNFFRSKKDKLQEEDGVVLAPCTSCGQPTIAGVCKFCRIKEKLQKADG